MSISSDFKYMPLASLPKVAEPFKIMRPDEQATNKMLIKTFRGAKKSASSFPEAYRRNQTTALQSKT